MKNISPKCKNCYDKGYSTEYVGESFALPDFCGDKKYKVADAGIRINYCNCKKGKELEKKANK